MGRLRWLFVFGALATATAAFAQGLLTQAELISRARPVASATVRYGPDPLQVVDVWLPRGRRPFPTVVMIHGGCWQTGLADRHLMDWAADDLRRRGYAVWNIEYRGGDARDPVEGPVGRRVEDSVAADSFKACLLVFWDEVLDDGHAAHSLRTRLWIVKRTGRTEYLKASARGRRLFLASSCGNCHSIRGTPASADVGPDLTHVGSRTTLAALEIPNNPTDLGEWIERSQDIKPGNQMPNFALPPAQLHALVAYLEQLR